MNFRSFGGSFRAVCLVVGFVGRFGGDLEVSGKFLARFFTYFVSFNVFHTMFLLYFGQGF